MSALKALLAAVPANLWGWLVAAGLAIVGLIARAFGKRATKKAVEAAAADARDRERDVAARADEAARKLRAAAAHQVQARGDASAKAAERSPGGALVRPGENIISAVIRRGGGKSGKGGAN